LKIVIFGLSISSSWGNGHATTFRSLLRALAKRGHRIVFFERDQEWYSSNRDLPDPSFCRLKIYTAWEKVRINAENEIRDSDVVVVGSYFPDGIQAIDLVLNCDVSVKAFYDIDTPITVSRLRTGDAEYIRSDQVAGFDLYLSFTGGPMLDQLRSEFAARFPVPLYCSVDPEKYMFVAGTERYTCDLSYMGTYAADRQPRLQELFCAPAIQLPGRRFLIAGSQYPAGLCWPDNVDRITHLNPEEHPTFYSSSALTLNLTRQQMMVAGYSPSVRLFEAAVCASAIVSDSWEGIETFLEPDSEILLADSSADVIRYLTEGSPSELARIGQRARERVLAEHISTVRARQFEDYVTMSLSKRKDVVSDSPFNQVQYKLQDA